MFCRAMEIGLLGSRIVGALKEPYLLVYVYSYAFCVVSTLLGFKLRTTNHYNKTMQMRKSRFFNKFSSILTFFRCNDP